MMWFLFFSLVSASKLSVEKSGLQMEKGQHIIKSFVQYVSNKDRGEKEGMFHQHFPEADVSFNITVTGTDVTTSNVFMMVKQTKDFSVSCDSFASVGEITELESGKIQISGSKNVDFDGFAAAYLCQKGVAEPFDLKMEVTFKNKHGYLECGYFGFINFEFCLGTMYVIVLFYWLRKLSQWQDNVMFFHKLLTAICIISMLDEFMKLYSLNYENKFDVHDSMKLFFIKVFHASKASLIHYAGFMLGFGWGMATNVVEEQSKIVAFCCLYFLLFLIQDDDKKMFERSKLQMVVVVMFCILDAIWATVIVAKVNDLKNELEEARQSMKSDFYAKFGKLINTSVFGGICLCLISVLFLNTSWRFSAFAKTWWFTYGCWKMMFFVVLVSAMHLFKPHQSSKMYAEAVQLPGDDYDGLESGNEEFQSSGNADLE